MDRYDDHQLDFFPHGAGHHSKCFMSCVACQNQANIMAVPDTFHLGITTCDFLKYSSPSSFSIFVLFSSSFHLPPLPFVLSVALSHREPSLSPLFSSTTISFRYLSPQHHGCQTRPDARVHVGIRGYRGKSCHYSALLICIVLTWRPPHRLMSSEPWSSMIPSSLWTTSKQLTASWKKT